jgi:hypothetical protein
MKRNWASIGSTVALVMLLLALNARPAGATTFTVTRTDDPPPNGCKLGDCSLREAIISANIHAGPDAITIPADTFTLSIPNVSGDENAAATGDLDITGALAITGAGAGATIIQAGPGIDLGIDRVFQIRNGAVVTITGVTVRYGVGYPNGGGIDNDDGTLTLRDSVIQDNKSNNGGGISNNYISTLLLTRTTIYGNEATAGDGGGIDSHGTLTLTESTVTLNMASDTGGGIDNFNFGHLTLSRSTVSYNLAKAGGGIYNADSTATLVNSILSLNEAIGSGGGLYNVSVASLRNVTIADNTADQDNNGIGSGGGVLNFLGGTLSFKNTLVGDNVDKNGNAPDCIGTLASQGYNLIENSKNCTITGITTGNLIGFNPNLGPLQDNGGPTQTQALLGWFGVNGGDPAGCTDANGQPLTTDQRGVHRPQGPRCDIGAFEREVVLRTFLPLVVR